MRIEELQLKKLFPRMEMVDCWVDELNKQLEEAGITTKEQVAMFLAQCGHESGNFTRFTENLNYSTDRLLAVFPKYFKTRADAEKVARRPQEIANIVYANRMGNGDSKSGDGWKYRGRGIIQLTGRQNYVKFTNYIKKPELLEKPDEFNTIYYYVKMAVWYWKVNALETISNIETVTRRINGGLNGIEERKKLFKQIMETL